MYRLQSLYNSSMNSSDVCNIAQNIIQHCMSISDRDDTDGSSDTNTNTATNTTSTNSNTNDNTSASTSMGRDYTKYIHTVILSRSQ